MNNHVPKICAALVLAVVAAAAGQACGQEKKTPKASYRLIGDTDAVWLLVRDTGTGYKLAVKPLDKDKPWRPVGDEWSGNVAAATAIGDSLVAFFADGGHMRYFPHRSDGQPGREAPEDLWPKDTTVLAACPAEDKADAVLVLVVRPVGRRATTRPARTKSPRGGSPDPPRRSRRTKLHELVLLQYAGQKWRQVTVMPSESARPPLRARLAARQKTIYILAEQPKPVLDALEEGKWRSIALPTELADAKPLAMAVIDKALVLVTFDSGRVSISKFASDKWSPARQVRRTDKPVTWPADAAPAVGEFGPKMALAWSENDKWLFAACELDGQLAETDPLDVFAMAGRRELLVRVQNIFFWAVFGVIVVLMFWPGQPLRTAPFSLPPTMKPARLSKRLAAACIDTLPFLIGMSPFLPWGKLTWNPRPSTEELTTFFSSPGLIYASLAFMVIYPACCFIMEHRFGATVGKMVLRLRVVANGGRPLTLRESALRNVSKITEILGLPLVFPLLFPILTKYRQRLGDKIAWTTVIDAELSLPTEPPLDDDRDKPSEHDEPEQTE